MSRQHAAMAVALAALLAVAGCTGADPATTTADGTATTTGAETTADSTTATTEGSTTERTTNGTEARIKRDALAAMAAVETYRIASTTNRTLAANDVKQKTETSATGVFDRAARELRVNRTTSGPGGVATVATYVVNRSLYQHSEAYLRQYDSTWITSDLSGAFASQWNALDTMTRQRATLANASVEVVGTGTVDGTRTYVVEADVNETAQTGIAADRIAGSAVNVTNATFTFWIATDSKLPLRSAGVVEGTVVSQGQEVAVQQRIGIRFSAYDEPVAVSLPGSAATAVSIGNSSAGTSANVAPPPAV